MLSFFPLAVLDEIWDVIESVSEGFLTYSFIKLLLCDGQGTVMEAILYAYRSCFC